jgi:predicted dehydrogenase
VDYTSGRLLFKLKKVLRYSRLYGPRRTMVKTQAQYHMKKRFHRLPPQPAGAGPGAHVGLLGCGNFGYSHIAFFLAKNHGRVLRGAMDIDIHRAASLSRRWDASYYTDDAARIIDDGRIDLVYIASNHASHADYAVRALERGKSVHIEKPHVVTEEQLRRLCGAMEHSSGSVRLGFNRPESRFGELIADSLNSQSGPAMHNWFIAGHRIEPDHWYFKQEEGGRVLGNLCHWTDFVYQLVPPEDRYPIEIQPTRAQKSDCDIVVTYVFGDGTIAAITFSAKGHTFEGVKERFAAHRGDVLISMDDFKTLTIDRGTNKRMLRQRYREHGHERAVNRSYELVRPVGAKRPGCTTAYVWETGELFLKSRDALEQNRSLTVQGHRPGVLEALRA